MANVFGTPGTNDVDYLKGGAEDDVLIGFGGADYLWGFDGDDELYGESGNDFLQGNDGDDVLLGGFGADTLHGDDGADRLEGGADNDRLYGGAGDDVLDGGAGDDTIRGGAGDDTIVGLSGKDDIDGGAGHDTLDASGLAGDGYSGVFVDMLTSNTYYDYGTSTRGTIMNVEEVVGTTHNDIFFAGASNDWFDGGAGDDIFIGGAGADYFWGDMGVDHASYSSAGSGVTVALQSFNSSGTGDARNDVLLQVENLSGSRYADSLTGDTQNNVIWGDAGNDVIDPRTGSDTVYGGSGADTFVFVASYSVTHGRTTTYTDRGDDVVKDYVDGVDSFRLEGYAQSEVSIRTSGTDAIIDAGWYVDIRVEGAAGDLDMGDILFA